MLADHARHRHGSGRICPWSYSRLVSSRAVPSSPTKANHTHSSALWHYAKFLSETQIDEYADNIFGGLVSAVIA